MPTIFNTLEILHVSQLGAKSSPCCFFLITKIYLTRKGYWLPRAGQKLQWAVNNNK